MRDCNMIVILSGEDFPASERQQYQSGNPSGYRIDHRFLAML
jgi:hypothetical protein